MDMYLISLIDLDMMMNVGSMSMTPKIHMIQIEEKIEIPVEKKTFQFYIRFLICLESELPPDCNCARMSMQDNAPHKDEACIE